MTEGSLTRDLKVRTELALAPPVVFTKHSDSFSAGIPDVSVDWAGETWWAEVKFVRPGSTVRREAEKHPIQLAKMFLRELACRRAVYLVYRRVDARTWTTALWLPSYLRASFEAGVATPIAAHPGRMALRMALAGGGGVEVSGIDHGLLARLVKERT